MNIDLRSHQIDNVRTLSNKLQNSHFVINSSPPGTGKTITTIYKAIHNKFDLHVFGPANIEQNWLREAKKYDIPCTFTSYSKMARGSDYVSRPKGTDNFIITDYLKSIIAKGSLIVYDEAQDLKNSSSLSSIACFEISKYLVCTKSRSRIIILSATLTDKEKLTDAIYKLAGIITRKELFLYELGLKTYTVKGYGYEQVVNYCRRLNPTLTAELEPPKFKAKSCREALYNMYVQIVVPNMTHSMPSPDISAIFKPTLGYYNMDEKYTERLNKAIEKLQNSVKNDNENNLVTIDGMVGIQKIMEAHQEIEYAKLTLFVRLAHQKLTENSNNKVIIYVWYRKSVEYLMNAFVHWNPIQANGEIKPNKRYIGIDKFMEHNNNSRLIIAHPRAAGFGISLDDTDGSFPRFTFMSSNYHFIYIHQCAGRTYRSETKSDSSFSIVYGKNNIEHSIMEALDRKNKVVKDINLNKNIVYPSDYPIYTEE
jgi:hypothetical protein